MEFIDHHVDVEFRKSLSRSTNTPPLQIVETRGSTYSSQTPIKQLTSTDPVAESVVSKLVEDTEILVDPVENLSLEEQTVPNPTNLVRSKKSERRKKQNQMECPVTQAAIDEIISDHKRAPQSMDEEDVLDRVANVSRR